MFMAVLGEVLWRLKGFLDVTRLELMVMIQLLRRIKMFKNWFCILGGLVMVAFMSGCDIKRDTMDDIDIYTTNYATEFITNRLYGEHSNIHSIYPDGIDINGYKLTNKQIKDYSDSDLYIFNGLSNEKEYVTKMRENNKNLKILDTTLAMEYVNGPEELWLDPSNLLMMAQNVKTGFKEYTDNYYLNNDINDNYEKLKVEASNLDAKIKQTVSNSDTKTIVVSDDLFKFLEKYGLTVYSLDEDSVTNKTTEDVKNLIRSGKIHYIFTKENEDLNKTTKDIIAQTGVNTLVWHTLSNITEAQRSANEDYFTLMNENIELLKNELYN